MRCLLDIQANFLWYLVEGVLHALLGVEVDPPHRQGESDSRSRDPTAQTRYFGRHLRISLPELLSPFLCSQCTGAAVGRVGLNLQDDEIAPAVRSAKHPRDAGK